MKNITDFIYKHFPPHISIPLILHIIILSGILYISRQEFWVLTSKKLYGSLPILTIAATATLLYLLLLASYILLCFKIRKKLNPKFGVSWDQEQEPYCPIHEKPLARHKTKINDNTVTGLDCVKCKHTYPLMTDEGKRITLPEAKKLLKPMNLTQQVAPSDAQKTAPR
jgi:hypothetical protein